MKSDRFCFTINNWTDSEHGTLHDIVLGLLGGNPDERFTYICYGFEHAPTTGTPHIQGYCELKSRYRHTQVNSWLGGRARLTCANGTAEDNRVYCSKEGELHEAGVPRPDKKKKRSADEAFECCMEDIKKGATIRQIASDYPAIFFKHHTGVQKAIMLFSRKDIPQYYGPFPFEIPRDIRSLVLKGKAGMGKTEFAKYLLPKALFIRHMDLLKTYNPSEHEGIIFDDMSFSHLPREGQIHLVDFDNPSAIHVRYGCAMIPAGTPKIFTTNVDGIFTLDEAIERRVEWRNLAEFYMI